MLNLPLRTGPDIDWRSKCHPGDSQGETDACTVFAIANYVECMLGTPIADADAIEVWRQEREFRYRSIDGGLTVTEAFAGAMIRGKWLPAGTSLRRVADLQTLPLAPLVVSFAGLDWSIEPGTDTLSKMAPTTRHAVLVVGDVAGGIWVENSHGAAWGDHGFARMSAATFRRHASQIWQIVLPGSPKTLAEAASRNTASLAEQIGDQVRSISKHLGTLGYKLPGDGRVIMADIISRSMAGQLTPAQQNARRDVADVYLFLMGAGITDDDINTVWEVIK